jgi:hypothetical protein
LLRDHYDRIGGEQRDTIDDDGRGKLTETEILGGEVKVHLN